MFVGKDGYERKTWHIVSEKGQVELLHKMWELGKEVLTRKELQSMFLGKDGYERTAWHKASQKSQIKLLHEIWEWAKMY